MQTKAISKETVHTKIRINGSAENICVLYTGHGSYLAFRTGLGENVGISAGALAALVEDLSRHKETLGFLLGYSDEEGVSFARYSPAKMPLLRRRAMVSYHKKDYLEELERLRRRGFNAQADLHNHPYEDDKRVPIKHSLLGLGIPFLLRHGLFGELEEEGRLSYRDRRSAEQEHYALKKRNIGYQRSFSGVLSTFYVKRLGSRVKILQLYGENGATHKPIGIEIDEAGA